tara:strand:+ start:612 stop:875 length:264 start_codon:yes stop_codon:yes gene_type:complete
MSEKCDYTIGSDEMEEIRTFVKERWNYPYLGRGMADRMQSIQDSYAKKLDEAGLKVIFVPTGNDTTMSELFTGKKGYYTIVEKEVTE